MLASLLLSLGLVVGLLAQAGLFVGDPGRPNHPDGLTTLALVLAVLAFLIQIIVFVVQTNAANSAVRRSEELNTQTHAVLGKIEAESTSTKEVLISQFNRLLDFVVDGGRATRPADSVERSARRSADAKREPDADQERPVTPSELQQALQVALRPPERPSFEVDATSGPSEEDQAVVDYMQAWPSKEEMDQAVRALTRLPPFALALLTRYGIIEIEQRLNGEQVGLFQTQPLPAITEDLISEGLLKQHDDRLSLTERGREVTRALPVGKASLELPDWFDEAIAPLSRT